MRSHRLAPGQHTLLDIAFNTNIDGPGRHGELVRLYTNDTRANKRTAQGFPLASGTGFYLTVS